MYKLIKFFCDTMIENGLDPFRCDGIIASRGLAGVCPVCGVRYRIFRALKS